MSVQSFTYSGATRVLFTRCSRVARFAIRKMQQKAATQVQASKTPKTLGNPHGYWIATRNAGATCIVLQCPARHVKCNAQHGGIHLRCTPLDVAYLPPYFWALRRPATISRIVPALAGKQKDNAWYETPLAWCTRISATSWSDSTRRFPGRPLARGLRGLRGAFGLWALQNIFRNLDAVMSAVPAQYRTAFAATSSKLVFSGSPVGVTVSQHSPQPARSHCFRHTAKVVVEPSLRVYGFTPTRLKSCPCKVSFMVFPYCNMKNVAMYILAMLHRERNPQLNATGSTKWPTNWYS